MKYTTFASDWGRSHGARFRLATPGGGLPKGGGAWRHALREVQRLCPAQEHDGPWAERAFVWALWYGMLPEVRHVYLPAGLAAFLQDSARACTPAFLEAGTLRALAPVAPGFFIHFQGAAPTDPPTDLTPGEVPFVRRQSLFVFAPGCARECSQCATGLDLRVHDGGRCSLSTGADGDFPAEFATPRDRAILRTLYGLSLYLAAFPDALIDFLPPDKEWRGRHGVTLRPCPEVAEDIGNAVSPHYRRGHFRVLGESFKAPGSVVYVKGCFVGHGVAKTVIA